MAAKHSTATRPQPPTGEKHKFGESENEHVFCTPKNGEKTPLKMVKDFWEASGISGFNRTFKGTYLVSSRWGFSMGFLLRLATNDEKHLETRPTVLRKMFGAGKPVKAGYKWALNAGVSTQTHATRFLRKGKQELKPR